MAAQAGRTTASVTQKNPAKTAPAAAWRDRKTGGWIKHPNWAKNNLDWECMVRGPHKWAGSGQKKAVNYTADAGADKVAGGHKWSQHRHLSPPIVPATTRLLATHAGLYSAEVKVKCWSQPNAVAMLMLCSHLSNQ